MKRTLFKSALALSGAAALLTIFATNRDAVGQTQKSTWALTAEQLPNPNDGEGAVLKHYTNLHRMRYMEFFLVGGVPLEGQIKGTCYNTSELNIKPGDRDTCPQSLVDKLNPEELAKQYGVKRVVLDPPREWLLDWADVPSGKVREFGGINAAWVAVVNMPKGESLPYHPTTIERNTKFGFTKGQTVYLLDDPEGNTWVMKSFTQVVSPQNTYENLPTVGKRLKLPSGWKPRTKVLDEELILIPATGVARIVRDDLDNVYDVTGSGYSNFTP